MAGDSSRPLIKGIINLNRGLLQKFSQKSILVERVVNRERCQALPLVHLGPVFVFNSPHLFFLSQIHHPASSLRDSALPSRLFTYLGPAQHETPPIRGSDVFL